MLDRHGDGLAAYGKPENNVAWGFVEGVKNKIRVIQRRRDGLRDEEDLRLKILTCMLDPIGNQTDITHSGRRRPCFNTFANHCVTVEILIAWP